MAPTGPPGCLEETKTPARQADSVQRGPPDPSMLDQEQLDDFLEALETAGSPVKNPALLQSLGWDEGLYGVVPVQWTGR